MKRIPGLQHWSYFESRRALRTRFRRLDATRVPEGGPLHEERLALPDDGDVLKLLLNTSRRRNSELAAAQQEYLLRHAQSTTQLPSLQEAMDRGWFRHMSGELVPAWALCDFPHFLNPPPAYIEELQSFRRWLQEQQYAVANQGTHGSAAEMEEWLVNYPASPGSRPEAFSRTWIAARLWDTQEVKDLRTWMMRWEQLSYPPVVPAKLWAAKDASAFRKEVLQNVHDANLPGWDAQDGADALLRQGDIRLGELPESRPNHLLGLYLGSDRGLDGRELYELDQMLTALGQLVLELPHIQPAPVPSPTAEALLNLALAHPDVLSTLVGRIHEEPEALADLVLCPVGCALVSYLVAAWASQRDEADMIFEEVQTSLLRDCLSIMTHFLSGEGVSPSEYAQLLVALQELDQSRRPGTEKLPVALDEIRGMSASLRTQVVDALVKQLRTERQPTHLATLLKVLGTTGHELSASHGTQVAENYRQWVSTTASPNASLIDASAAGALLKVAVQAAAAADDILRAIDVRSALSSGARDASFNVSLALKEHIRVLCRGVAGYPGTVPGAVVTALSDAIRNGACDRPSRHQVDAFSFNLDYSGRERQRPIELDVLAAVNRVESSAQRKELVNALLLLEEPLVLAPLAQRGPRDQQERVRSHLAQLTPDKASRAGFIQQSQRRIDAFFELGMTDLASAYVQDKQESLRGRSDRSDIRLGQLRNELHLHYQRGDDQIIEQALVPPNLKQEDEREANRTIQFFRGLVLLRQNPPNATDAAAIFNSLYREQHNSSYAINLLAARTIKLLGDQLYRVLSGAELAQARQALVEADAALPNPASLPSTAQVPHAYNMAALLLATGQTQEAYLRLQMLDPMVRNSEAVAFEAVALFRMREQERALALIRSARERFSDAEAVTAAESHILHATSSTAVAHTLQFEDADTRIREAIALFRGMSPRRQAAAISPGAAPLEQVLTDHFRDALASFERSLSSLKLHTTTYLEDDFNGLLAEMVQGRIDTAFGWQAHEQSPGGFTAAGNQRRRDMVVRVRGVDIAAFEALISKQPNDAKISEHLHKLFSYTTAEILIHVTYSHRPNVAEMVEGVKQAAMNVPAGTEYVDQREIPAEGSRPGGIRAAYRRGGVDVAVLFFIVDIAQVTLRQASNAPQTASVAAGSQSTLPAGAPI